MATTSMTTVGTDSPPASMSESKHPLATSMR